MLNFDEYQKQTARTDSDYSHIKREDIPKLVHALGMCGEKGELGDYIKKCVAHGHPVDREKIVKEAGDVLWYLARICADFDILFSEVPPANLKKLLERYPDKFTSADSIARVDTK